MKCLNSYLYIKKDIEWKNKVIEFVFHLIASVNHISIGLSSLTGAKIFTENSSGLKACRIDVRKTK
jgi:hypothetical protein